MKKGETPELSAKWWKTSQPAGLASAGKLELALRAHEVAVAAFRKEPKDDRLKQALDTLGAVEDAAGKTIGEAARAKGNPQMEFTVQALRKIDFKKVASLLEGSVAPADDEEEEAGAAILKDPVQFARYLRKSLVRVADEPWMWGFLAGKKPKEHRFLLHRTKNGRTVATAAAKALGRPAKVSFGTVIRSPDEAATIILTVQGAMLAGLATRMTKMLHALQPQSADTVLLMVDGVTVPEVTDPGDVDEPDDDGATISDAATQRAPSTRPTTGPGVDVDLEALHRRIDALEPRAAAVMIALPNYRDQLTTSIDQLMAAMAREDAARAAPLLVKIEEVVKRLEDAQARATQPSQPQASAARAAEAAAEIRAALPGNVTSAVGLAKLRLRLRAAAASRVPAAVNMEKAILAVIDSGEYDNDPDKPAMRAAAGTVAQRIPPMEDMTEAVQAALDKAAGVADPARRKDELQPAIAALDRYLATLEEDEMLRTLQNTNYGTFAIYDQIVGPVRDLRAALAA